MKFEIPEIVVKKANFWQKTWNSKFGSFDIENRFFHGFGEISQNRENVEKPGFGVKTPLSKAD